MYKEWWYDISSHLYGHKRQGTWKIQYNAIERDSKLDVLLLQVEASIYDVEGHGATILSLRSQMNPIPVVLSNIASEGGLGNRQPDPRWNDWANLDKTSTMEIECSL